MNTLPPLDEKELLQRVAKGDHHAFRVLYDRHSKKIYHFARKILNSDILAEEVMQETLLKLWKMEDALNQINHLDGYLKTISRNYCYNLLRRQQLERKTDADRAGDWDEAVNDTEELVLVNEAKELVKEAKDAMPQYHRNVYELCREEGKTYDEAASLLNLSRHTVQTYMKLALRFIREYISNRSNAIALFIIFNFF